MFSYIVEDFVGFKLLFFQMGIHLCVCVNLNIMAVHNAWLL